MQPMTPASNMTLPIQDEARNALGTAGPEFTIQSGAFGGAWSSKSGAQCPTWCSCCASEDMDD